MKLLYNRKDCTYMTYGKTYMVLSYDPNHSNYCYCSNDYGVISMISISEFIQLKKLRKEKLEKINEI